MFSPSSAALARAFSSIGPAMSIADTAAPSAGGPERDLPRPRRQIEDTVARLDAQALHQLVLHRREPCRQPLVRPGAPDLAHAFESILLPVGDLFSEAAGRRLGASAPLAQRLRPLTLDDFVGQEHVIGPGRALRLAIEADRVPSLILYGPPGSGKTTLARIVAQTTGAEFEELSAVSATVANVREVLARARERLGATGRRTILFLDEIHRFNKAQQDALLPGVEDGLVTLIGATTENPYFELNSALLSRVQVYELEPLLERDAARGRAPRGAQALGVERRAGGRGADRHAAPAAMPATRSASSSSRSRPRGPRAARSRRATSRTRRASGRSLYDKGGDAHYDFISAWIKSTRAGDVQASVYYLAAMLEGGEDARFIARRMIVLASEDIGNADPQALARRRRRGAGGRARRAARGAAQPRAGRGLPRARAEVERLLPRDRRRDRRRPRARPPPPARRAPLGLLPGRAQARPRRGLRLPARRPGRVRGRLPPRRAEGPRLLQAVRERRGALLEDPGAEGARGELDGELRRSRSPGRGSGSPRRARASRAGPTRRRARARGAPRGRRGRRAPACRRRARTSGRRRRGRG